MKRLRKVGTTFIGYWAVASFPAASAGMCAKLIKPGRRGNLPELQEQEVNVDPLDSLINWMPNNVAQAFAEGSILQIRVLVTPGCLHFPYR